MKQLQVYGLGSFVPIEQVYPPLLTLSGAHQEPGQSLWNIMRAQHLKNVKTSSCSYLYQSLFTIRS